MKRLLVVNLVLLVFFLLILESFSYISIFTSDKIVLPDYKKFKKIKDEFLVDNHLYINYKKPKETDPIHFKNDGRSFSGKEFNSQKAILLLGDSYTYGLGLNKSETFSEQLSKYIKRPVYNWGWCTEGIEYSLMQLKDERNIKKIYDLSGNIKEPIEYVIYTYSYNQPARILSPNRQYRLFYLRKYGLIDNQKFSVFDRLYTVLAVKNKIFQNRIYKNSQSELFNLIEKEIQAIHQEVKKHFPNAKFILLIYSDDENIVANSGLKMTETEKIILNSPRWKNFEKQGIIVLTTEELTGKKASADEVIENERTVTIHPNAKAWKNIIPPLVSKLKQIK